MTNGRPPLSSLTEIARGAETSSGRLWSATAFTAVAARLWLRPRPRMRTTSNLSRALPTSPWPRTWTTSRRFAIAVTSLKARGTNEIRILWKAGRLETCTSGLGLGSRCNSSAYTTWLAPLQRVECRHHRGGQHERRLALPRRAARATRQTVRSRTSTANTGTYYLAVTRDGRRQRAFRHADDSDQRRGAYADDLDRGCPAGQHLQRRDDRDPERHGRSDPRSPIRSPTTGRSSIPRATRSPKAPIRTSATRLPVPTPTRSRSWPAWTRHQRPGHRHDHRQRRRTSFVHVAPIPDVNANVGQTSRCPPCRSPIPACRTRTPPRSIGATAPADDATVTEESSDGSDHARHDHRQPCLCERRDRHVYGHDHADGPERRRRQPRLQRQCRRPPPWRSTVSPPAATARSFEVSYTVANATAAPFNIGIYTSPDGTTPDQCSCRSRSTAPTFR